MANNTTTVQYVSGSYRVLRPSDLLENVTPLLATAGVTRLANITGLDRIGIPVVTAVRPQGATLSVCAGKGVSFEESVASAAMEAIEFHSAETFSVSSCVPRLPMDIPRVMPLDGLPLRHHALDSEAADLEWVIGTDLLSDAPCAVPFSAVTLLEPRDIRSPLRQTSNGLASGATVAEAILASLLEVVERDALATWESVSKRTGGEPPRVDSEALEASSRARALVRQIEDAHVTPVVYDCTVDTLVPVYLVRLVDQLQRQRGIFRGSGAHLDAEVALVRALTEAAQSRAVYIAGTRDDLSCREFAQLRAQDSPRVVERLLAQRPVTKFKASTPRTGRSLEALCRQVLERLAAVGCSRVVLVDLTPDSMRSWVAVVRIIAPGLAASGVPEPIIDGRARALLDLADA